VLAPLWLNLKLKQEISKLCLIDHQVITIKLQTGINFMSLLKFMGIKPKGNWLNSGKGKLAIAPFQGL
jgi:hypothetical protein